MRVASIDPGVKRVGFAVWEDSRLKQAGICEPTLQDWMRGLDEIVIEKPQVYVAARSKGDPNDLVELALVVGWMAGIAWMADNAAAIYYKPSEWKGQLPKQVCHDRVIKALMDREREAIVLPPNKRHALDVLDAIGIGLYHLGRSRPC